MFAKVLQKFLRLFYKNISICYAVTVCNEDKELNKLLEILVKNIDKNDELIVLSDKSNVTDEVMSIIQFYQNKYPVLHISYQLEGDFASFKNKLISKASKKYLFQIDADEYPNIELLKSLKLFMLINPVTDCFLVPRVNIVKGITPPHITKWKWNIDSQNRINYPDFQMRIFKLNKNIRWENKVHEKLINYKHKKKLPFATENYCLYHIKELSKQERQNELYDKML